MASSETYQKTTPEGIQYAVVDGRLTRLKLSGSDTQKSWFFGSERLGKKTERGLKKIFKKYRVDSETEVDLGEYTQRQFYNSRWRAANLFALKATVQVCSCLPLPLLVADGLQTAYGVDPLDSGILLALPAAIAATALYYRDNPYAHVTLENGKA